MTTRAAAAAALAAKEHEQTPKKSQQVLDIQMPNVASIDCFGKNIHIRSQPNSREVSPAPVFNIFTPRARRYSASYSPLTTAANGATLCLTPRVSQLRQEECADLNSRVRKIGKLSATLGSRKMVWKIKTNSYNGTPELEIVLQTDRSYMSQRI